MHEVNYRPNPRGDYLIHAGMTVPDSEPSSSSYLAARVAILAQDLDVGDLISGTVVDGVAVSPGDRVLRFGNTGSHYAGIYVVQAPSNAAIRSTDLDTLEEMIANPLVSVSAGLVYAGVVFQISTDGDLDFGVSIMPI